MPYLLQVDFQYQGPWGDGMTAALRGLAESIANEPGLIWKIWTENQAAGEAGGIYLQGCAKRGSLLGHAYRTLDELWRAGG